MATILVVDDSLVSQRTLCFILGQNDHLVLTASDGLEALNTLSNYPIDLVITDISMPKMDGVKLLKQVRDIQEYQQLPVIILTCLGTNIKQSEAMAAGANGILTKPTSSWQLTEMVNRLLAESVW